MTFQATYNPRLSKADVQERIDIYEGRKPVNYALNVRESKLSTQVCGELTYIQNPPGDKPNIK